jgi:hypothetical protein
MRRSHFNPDDRGASTRLPATGRTIFDLRLSAIRHRLRLAQIGQEEPFTSAD